MPTTRLPLAKGEAQACLTQQIDGLRGVEVQRLLREHGGQHRALSLLVVAGVALVALGR